MTPNSFYTNNNKIQNYREEFGKQFLVDIVDWVGYTFEPEDVYNQSQLKEWCKDTLDFTEIAEDEDILDYVRKNFNPDEVFSEKELSEWAVDHNYEKL